MRPGKIPYWLVLCYCKRYHQRSSVYLQLTDRYEHILRGLAVQDVRVIEPSGLIRYRNKIEVRYFACSLVLRKKVLRCLWEVLRLMDAERLIRASYKHEQMSQISGELSLTQD